MERTSYLLQIIIDYMPARTAASAIASQPFINTLAIALVSFYLYTSIAPSGQMRAHIQQPMQSSLTGSTYS